MSWNVQLTRDNQESWRTLRSSAISFRAGEKTQGFQKFNSANLDHRNKVYEQLALDHGMSYLGQRYGRQAFHEANGRSSTLEGKASSIDTYLREVITRQKATRYTNTTKIDYVYDPSSNSYRNREVTDMNKYGYNCEIDCPKPWDPDYDQKCTGVTYGAAFFVAVGCIANCFFK